MDIEPNLGYFHCHCGWTTPYYGGPYADPPLCEICECYTMAPGENTGLWSTDKDCIVEKRKRYPYLQTIVDYIGTLAHQNVEFYVKAKAAKQFNLTKEEVKNVYREIDEMNGEL
jgi:hypothetical protein